MSSALYFNNLNWLDTGDSSSLDITGALTVFAWYYRSAGASATESILSKWDDYDGANDRSYLFGHDSSERLAFNISSDGSTADYVLNTVSDSNGIWYFAAGVFVPSTSLTLYRGTTPDGITQQNQNTTSIPASIYNGAAELWLGQYSDPTNSAQSFTGGIFSAGIIADSATLAELKALAYGIDPVQLFGSNVKAFYRLFDLNSYQDLSGNGNALSEQGTAPSEVTTSPPIHQYVQLGISGTPESDTKQLVVDINGSGTVAADLSVDNLSADIIGSGTVTADVVRNKLALNVAITGSALVEPDLAMVLEVGNTIQWTQEATVEKILNISVESTLSITQTVLAPAILNESASNSIVFSQNVIFAHVLPTKTASNSITFAQNVDYARPAQNTINFTQLAVGVIGGIDGIAANTLTLTQDIDLDLIINLGIDNELLLSQEAIGNYNVVQSLTSTLDLRQEVNFVLLEGGTVSGEDYTKQYVYLQAPFNSIASTVILPAPLWGDTENIASEMRLLRAMNGVIRTYVKTTKNRRLTYTFRLLERAKAVELLTFLKSYDSEKMKLTNWKGEVWEVNLLNNPSDFVQTRRYGTDIALEFEGEKLYG